MLAAEVTRVEAIARLETIAIRVPCRVNVTGLKSVAQEEEKRRSQVSQSEPKRKHEGRKKGSKGRKGRKGILEARTLLGAPGLTTRSKDVTSNKGHRY